MRLSSLRPINFQYHSQAAATGCVGCIEVAVDNAMHNSSTFKEAKK